MSIVVKWYTALPMQKDWSAQQGKHMIPVYSNLGVCADFSPERARCNQVVEVNPSGLCDLEVISDENAVDKARNKPCEWVFGSKNEGMLIISIELDWCKGPYEVVRMRGKLKHGFLVREFSTLKELQAILADYTGTEFKSMVSLPAIVGELRLKAELITGHAFPSYCRDGFLNALVFTENADV